MNTFKSYCFFLLNIRLAFCDLAGAERADKSQSFGTRLREAGTINTGLFTLGKCIEVIRSNQLEPDKYE